MCGLAGIVTDGRVFSARSATEADAFALQLENMGDRVGHRGPDEGGIFHADGVGLAHRRLSIIDLHTGRQPLCSEDGALVLLVNGEIYNHVELRAELEARGHRFTTRSDSECLLHGYLEAGMRFLDRVRGMFAFALYDRRTESVWLVRDRLGIKPLFYCESRGAVAFASELKALITFNGPTTHLHSGALAQIFQSNFSTGRATVVPGIERVLPGEAVELREGRIVGRQRYWQPTPAPDVPKREEEALEAYDGLLRSAIREHLRADVPVGLFLSGGLDSAAILALMREESSADILTFTARFPGRTVRDESDDAALLASHYGVEHVIVPMQPAAMIEKLCLGIWAADELMPDYANLPTLMLAEVASASLKVVLTGEGGDEVLAGYGRYRQGWLRSRWGRNRDERHGFRVRPLVSPELGWRLFAEPAVFARWGDAFAGAWRETDSRLTWLQRAQLTDCATWLPDDLLVKADRMLMCFGLEGRVPFLDHRLVEFGLGLPDRLKIRGRRGKWLHRRWLAGKLPDNRARRGKSGFTAPLQTWLSGPLLDHLQRVLPDHCALAPWFRAEGIRWLLTDERARRKHLSTIWALLHVALWHELFVNRAGERPDGNVHWKDWFD